MCWFEETNTPPITLSYLAQVSSGGGRFILVSWVRLLWPRLCAHLHSRLVPIRSAADSCSPSCFLSSCQRCIVFSSFLCACRVCAARMQPCMLVWRELAICVYGRHLAWTLFPDKCLCKYHCVLVMIACLVRYHCVLMTKGRRHCKPAPGQAVGGYAELVGRQRGYVMHRSACAGSVR